MPNRAKTGFVAEMTPVSREESSWVTSVHRNVVPVVNSCKQDDSLMSGLEKAHSGSMGSRTHSQSRAAGILTGPHRVRFSALFPKTKPLAERHPLGLNHGHGIGQSSDAGYVNMDHIACLQSEFIWRYNSSAGEQYCSVGEFLTARQPPR